MKISGWLVSIILVTALMPAAVAEEVTVTTYYPSPDGKYKELETTDQTLLATDTASETARVGIGTTTPQAALDVAGDGGAIIVPRKSTAGDPTGVNGMIYYNTNTNKFRAYENGTWKDMCSGTQPHYLKQDIRVGTTQHYDKGWIKVDLSSPQFSSIPSTATAVILQVWIHTVEPWKNNQNLGSGMYVYVNDIPSEAPPNPQAALYYYGYNNTSKPLQYLDYKTEVETRNLIICPIDKATRSFSFKISQFYLGLNCFISIFGYYD